MAKHLFGFVERCQHADLAILGISANIADMTPENEPPAKAAEKKEKARLESTALDPVRRFANIWLATAAAFCAGGLIVGGLLVAPHDYLERDLPGVWLATIQAQLAPALANGLAFGIFLAILILSSRRLGGRFRARLGIVLPFTFLFGVWLALARIHQINGKQLLASQILARWGSPLLLFRSFIHFGMEEEHFGLRLVRIGIIGIVGISLLFLVHLPTRRLLRLPKENEDRGRPATFITPVLFLIVFFMMIVLGRGATDQLPPRSPDVILISLDTLRADHLSAYGYPRETSPNLDEFARQSVLVENFIAHAPWTLPAHASMFTGLMPYETGAIEPTSTIDPRIGMFPEILKQRGYRTGAFVTGLLVSAPYGFNRGFDVFTCHEFLEAAQNARNALTWLALSRAPTFMFLHMFDLHYPYRPNMLTYTRFGQATPFLMMPGNDNFATFVQWADRDPMHTSQSSIDRYDEEILYVDMVLGKFFDALKKQGRYDNALIIALSDHGEEFYDHGAWGHSNYFYEESLHVPLIVKLPGNACAGLRIKDGLVPQKTVAQMILAAAGNAPEKNPALVCGPAGIPQMLREAITTQPVLSETQSTWPAVTKSVHRFAARSTTTKLIEPYQPKDPRAQRWNRDWELYDLRVDPAERFNIYEPGKAADLEAILADANRRLAEKTGIGKNAIIDNDTIQRLRSLGYLQ
jgi:arylsulfatase A-like enzyme